MNEDMGGDLGPEPCHPIGCDNGYHLPGCVFEEKAPITSWWTISGQALMDALRRVQNGDSPDIVYLELSANSQTEDYRNDGGDGSSRET